ncbi:MAG: rhodanese-like domain-containing protein [Ignavibacteria bacterium]|nr:rhodanese-like domain-containing protein [Ignavibacteria bacterium]
MITSRLKKIISAINGLPLFVKSNSKHNIPLIKMVDFKELLKKETGLIIVDVRTPEELSGSLGKIPGVINIPLQELNERFEELNKFKQKTIYIICRSGNRSGIAVNILNSKGFNSVNVLGGMIKYNK